MRIRVLAPAAIALAVQSCGAFAGPSDLREAQQEALACSERLLHVHAVIDCEPVILVVAAALDGCSKTWSHAADIITPKPADLGQNDKTKKYLESLMSGFMGMRREIWPQLETEAIKIRKEAHLLMPGRDPLPGYVCWSGTLIRKEVPKAAPEGR